MTASNTHQEAAETRIIKADELPESANLNEWSRLLGVSYPVIQKRRRRGQLRGSRNPITGEITVTRQEALDSFRQERWYTIVNENGSGSEKPARRKSQPQPSTA
jgi:hypothetical protein